VRATKGNKKYGDVAGRATGTYITGVSKARQDVSVSHQGVSKARRAVWPGVVFVTLDEMALLNTQPQHPMQEY
jgi:hypothetical protein